MDPVIRRDEISLVFDKIGTGCEGVGVGGQRFEEKGGSCRWFEWAECLADQ